MTYLEICGLVDADVDVEIVCSEFLVLIFSDQDEIEIIKNKSNAGSYCSVSIKLIESSGNKVLADDFNSLYNFYRYKYLIGCANGNTTNGENSLSSIFIDRDSHKEVSRLLTRVQKWKYDWTDIGDLKPSISCNNIKSIDDEISPQLLLERQFRHYCAIHINDCFTGKNNSLKMKSIGLCFADVYLYILLNQWICRNINQLQIQQNFPFIFQYVCGIHYELKNICLKFSCLQTSLLMKEIEKISSVWRSINNTELPFRTMTTKIVKIKSSSTKIKNVSKGNILLSNNDSNSNNNNEINNLNQNTKVSSVCSCCAINNNNNNNNNNATSNENNNVHKSQNSNLYDDDDNMIHYLINQVDWNSKLSPAPPADYVSHINDNNDIDTTAITTVNTSASNNNSNNNTVIIDTTLTNIETEVNKGDYLELSK